MFNFISQNISPLKAQALLKLNARVPIVATPQPRCPSAPLSEKKKPTMMEMMRMAMMMEMVAMMMDKMSLSAKTSPLA